jgi:hypothetical protein
MMAKTFLAVGILLAIALLLLAIRQVRANTEVQQIIQSLHPGKTTDSVFNKEMVADLPEPAQRYFLHAIAPGTPLANSVHLTMRGSIRLSPEQAWMPLRATEILSTKGFVWQAIAGQGMMQMRGADYYTHGKGRMQFSLWGLIPVVDAQDANVLRSALGRWVGEYFWLPSALLPQQGVSWQAIDTNTIQANLEADGEPITLIFVIDHQGKLLRGSLLRWGNQTKDGHYAEIPFGGDHQAERTFGGYTIPSQMGAGWRIGTKRYFEFFRTTIEQAQFH